MEFTIGEHKYRSRTLKGNKQFHISRRLAPVLTSFSDVLGHVQFDPVTNKVTALDPEAALKAAEPLALVVARMDDEQWDYIIRECLKVCVRVQPDGSVINCWNEQAGEPQFDDLDMMGLVQIVRYVVQESLGPFLGVLQSTS